MQKKLFAAVAILCMYANMNSAVSSPQINNVRERTEACKCENCTCNPCLCGTQSANCKCTDCNCKDCSCTNDSCNCDSRENKK